MASVVCQLDHECYNQFDGGILDGKIDDVLLQVSQVACTGTFMFDVMLS